MESQQAEEIAIKPDAVLFQFVMPEGCDQGMLDEVIGHARTIANQDPEYRQLRVGRPTIIVTHGPDGQRIPTVIQVITTRQGQPLSERIAERAPEGVPDDAPFAMSLGVLRQWAQEVRELEQKLDDDGLGELFEAGPLLESGLQHSHPKDCGSITGITD